MCEQLVRRLRFLATAEDATGMADSAMAMREAAAELERLRKDAARYRWLRDDAFKHSADCFFDAGQLFAGHQGDSFDVAIDAAIAGEKK